MSQGIKKINIDENNNGFALSTKVVGDGSLFIKSGDDYILQEDMRNGIGILAVDLATTNASGNFTIFPPDAIGSNTDDNFELDSNNDIVTKS